MFMPAPVLRCSVFTGDKTRPKARRVDVQILTGKLNATIQKTTPLETGGKTEKVDTLMNRLQYLSDGVSLTS